MNIKNLEDLGFGKIEESNKEKGRKGGRADGELETHQRVDEQYPLAPAQTGDSHWTPVSPH